MLQALAHFKSEYNLVFDSLSPFNEPGSPAWVEPIAVQECCYFSHGRMNDVRRPLFRAGACLVGGAGTCALVWARRRAAQRI
jgi:hypothetical protein